MSKIPEWMKNIGKIEDSTKEEKPVQKPEQKVVNKNEYEVLTPHYNKELKKFFISKVKFNPEEFETYEMQEKALAKQFESEQNILTTFYNRYKREKK
jgi:hypothetical protein